MVCPVVPFADPLSCVLLPRGMIGPWFHFGEALMQCLPPDKRTEVNLQWFKTALVDSWTPSQEQRNLGPGGVVVGCPPRTPAQARVYAAPGDVPTL